MKHHDSNIDPFNAGEPVMPWDMPEDSFASESDAGEPCELPESDYVAPIKQEDSYSGARKGSSESSQHEDSEASNATKPTQVARKLQAHKAQLQNDSDKQPYETEQPPTNKVPSVAKPTKKQPSRRSPAVRIVIIIVVISILISVLNLAFSLVANVAGRVSDAISDATYELTDRDTDYTHEEDEDDQAARAFAEETLDALSTNETARAALAEYFANKIQVYTDYTADELGIDTAQYVDAVLAGFSYTITDVYAFPDSGYASIYFDTAQLDTSDLGDDLISDIYSYLHDQGLTSRHKTLSDTQKQHVAELYEDALDNLDSVERSSGYLRLTYSAETDSYSVEESDFDDMLTSALWLY